MDKRTAKEAAAATPPVLAWDKFQNTLYEATEEALRTLPAFCLQPVAARLHGWLTDMTISAVAQAKSAQERK